MIEALWETLQGEKLASHEGKKNLVNIMHGMWPTLEAS
jgi:hypothetical protein